jgi:hypothetical protein
MPQIRSSLVFFKTRNRLTKERLELVERGLICPSIAGPKISLLSFDMR